MSGGATPKKRGTAFEYSVISNLKRHGWPLAVRSYASKGPWDVLAIRAGARLIQGDFGEYIEAVRIRPQVWLVQAKIGGYMKPAEREALMEAAHSIGAVPVLATSEKRRVVYYRVVQGSPRGESLTAGDT